MVEKFFKRFSSPFVIAAFAFAILIYSHVGQVKNRFPYKSLLPLSNVESINGVVCSNPVKLSSGKYYSFTVSLESVLGSIKKNVIQASASGKIQVFIPSSIVESLFPGKLYSTSKSNILIEDGEFICLKGKYKNSIFFAESATPLIREKTFFSNLKHFRALCRLKFKRLMFGWKNAGGFILSLLSGSREYTESSISEFFRKAGLSHILALSGMHLSFFASIFGTTGKTIFGKKLDSCFKLVGILFFVWFAGLTPSLFRALLCSIVLIVCDICFCSDVDLFKILCFVFLLHCVILPEQIFSLAFILSYAALAGILLFSDFFSFALLKFLPLKIANLLSASFSANVATFPICIFYFREVFPIGILASAFMSPLISCFLVASIIAIMVSFMIPFLSPIFGNLLNIFYFVIKTLAKLFSFAPSIKI